jgi:hypothetical protein
MDCDVVYFPRDANAPIFRRAALLVRTEAEEKAQDVPVCHCFGITRKDLEDEIASSGCSTAARRIAAEVRSGNCACEVKNPSGRCCLGRVAQVVRDFAQSQSVVPDASAAVEQTRKMPGAQNGARQKRQTGSV